MNVHSSGLKRPNNEYNLSVTDMVTVSELSLSYLK